MNTFIKSFYYAYKGISYTFRTQPNFKVECLTAVLAAGLSWYLHISTMEWLWIIAVMGIVLMAELLNTAMETLVDLVSPGYDPKAGKVKDISAAVVLIAALLASLTGMIIFLPKLINAA